MPFRMHNSFSAVHRGSIYLNTSVVLSVDGFKSPTDLYQQDAAQFADYAKSYYHMVLLLLTYFMKRYSWAGRLKNKGGLDDSMALSLLMALAHGFTLLLHNAMERNYAF